MLGEMPSEDGEEDIWGGQAQAFVPSSPGGRE